MNTKKLLERAARAVGMRPPFQDCGVWFAASGVWEPHRSLSDALKLAVDLEIDIEFYSDSVCACNTDRNIEADEFWKDHPDKYSAVCMAILRAAAAMGEPSAKGGEG